MKKQIMYAVIIVLSMTTIAVTIGGCNPEVAYPEQYQHYTEG